METTEYTDGGSHKYNKICVLTDIAKDENGNLVFSTTPNVLFSATGWGEMEIVSNITSMFKGYELVTIK